MDSWIPVALVVALAMGFNYTNGFHDAANAIATSVSTRALTPRLALAMAAVANLVGAFLGTKVAKTVGSGIIDAPAGTVGLTICAAALIGAIAWNLLTWWFGLPSSSSHALIGGLGGAAIAASTTVHWAAVLEKVILLGASAGAAWIAQRGLSYAWKKTTGKDAPRNALDTDAPSPTATAPGPGSA